MKTVIINDPQILFEELEKLQKENYIFRGQANNDSDWYLKSSAFRKNNLKKAADSFPASDDAIKQNWYFRDRVKNTVNAWFPGSFVKGSFHPGVARFLDLTVHIMRYNYRLTEYFKNNGKGLSGKGKRMIQDRVAEFWSDENTFQYLVENEFMHLIERWSLDGILIQEACVSECLTGLDETVPQHYGFSTAALDFSQDPYIALFFALELDKSLKYIPNGYPYFAIYAYKQRVDIIDPFVSIRDPDESWGTNKRAKCQQGKFIYFNKPCSFYLTNGYFPSIDDYDNIFNRDEFSNKRCFDLVKYKVRKEQIILDKIRKILDEKGLTKDFLMGK